MRKELLLQKKRKIVEKMPWYLRQNMTDEYLQMFSRDQLRAMCDLAIRSHETQENHSPFLILSATEVVQKETGMIADFTENGVLQVTEEEILSGAAGPAYKEYKRKSE